MKNLTRIVQAMVCWLPTLWLLPVASVTAQRGHAVAVDSYMSIDVAHSPNGSLIAVASNRGIDIFDAASGKRKFQHDTNEGIYRVLKFSPDGESIAAICDGRHSTRVLGEAVLWRFSKNARLEKISAGNQSATFREFVFSPRYEELFVVEVLLVDDSENYSSRIRSLTGTDDVVEHASIDNRFLEDLHFVDGGKQAIVLEGHSRLNVYDTSDWSLAHQVQLENGKANSMDVANGRILVVGSAEPADQDTEQRVYWTLDLEARGPVTSRPLSDPGKYRAHFQASLTPDGTSMVVQTIELRRDRNTTSIVPIVELRDVESGTAKWRHACENPGDRARVSFASNGKQLAVVDEDQMVLLNAGTGSVEMNVNLER